MNERDEYPTGVPCWVETLQPDPHAAREFYGPLLGWEFGEPGPMPGELPGEYFVARVRGRDVAGIGSLPDLGGPPVPSWNTYVRVGSADAAAASVQAHGGGLLVGPVDALPAGRLAVLADPAGAAISVWQAHARAGAQLVNEPSTWLMSSLHTTDVEGAKTFYGSMFGWEPEAYGPLTLLRLPGYVGGDAGQPVPRDVVAVIAPQTDAGSTVPPHWNVNLRVGDADAIAERTAALGGRVIAPPQDGPGLRSAVLADPQGAVFSISQMTDGR